MEGSVGVGDGELSGARIELRVPSAFVWAVEACFGVLLFGAFDPVVVGEFADSFVQASPELFGGAAGGVGCDLGFVVEQAEADRVVCCTEDRRECVGVIGRNFPVGAAEYV